MTFAEFKKQYKIVLNDQQSTAVQATDGATLLLAVPGSGKTTTLITRLGYMTLGCGIEPESILTMTYTVAATKDMRNRFATMFGSDLANRIQFRTINGICAVILSYYERTTGKKSFRLISEEKHHAKIVAGILYKVHDVYPQESEIKAAMLGIAYAKNQMLTDDQISELEEVLEVQNFLKVYTEYNNHLRQERKMDYDDQMVYARKILIRFPEVLEHFRAQFKYFCVDEAQDTSKIQHEIISILAGRYNNLFMVGDEDQSIYGFRAAYPKALLQFNERYPGGKTLLLEQNYRSSVEIVDAANKFIAQNKNRYKKTIVSTRTKKEPVKEISVKTREGQYEKLLEVAKNCKRETAILYRDNDSAIALIDLLERKGIPYITKQMESAFFSHRTVKDVSDVIALYYDPHNWAAFLNIYYKFDMPIKKAQLVTVQNENMRESVLKAITGSKKITASQKASVDRFFALLNGLRKAKSGAEAVEYVFEEMHYKQYLKRMKIHPGKIEIMRLVGKHEKDGKALLARLALLKEIISSPTKHPNAKFILSTIHSSKGLEYERVYLMDVIDGIFPKEDDGLAGDDEEERRLFYVGMTRAKNSLSIFTFPNKDGDYASFAAEIFPHLPKPEKQQATSQKRNLSSTSAQREQNAAQMIRRNIRESSRLGSSVCRSRQEPPLEDSKMIRDEIMQYHKDVRVKHSRFGKGTVKLVDVSNRNFAVAEISFDKEAVIRKIDLDTAIKNDMICRI